MDRRVLGRGDLPMNKTDSLPDLKHKVFVSLTMILLGVCSLPFVECGMNKWLMNSLYSSHLFLVPLLPLLLGSTLSPLLHCPSHQILHTLVFSSHFYVNSFQTYISCLSSAIACFQLLVGHLHTDMPAQKQDLFQLNLSSSPYKCTLPSNIYIV